MSVNDTNTADLRCTCPPGPSGDAPVEPDPQCTQHGRYADGGDVYENCCPHCGFCGDAHSTQCANCGIPPQFTHDDTEFCRYLSHFDGHDLYVHHEGVPTYVARYGNDGPDYKSGAVFVGTDPHITAAHRIAIALGIAIHEGVPEVESGRDDLVRILGGENE